ncbi:MAG: hypothetical protein QOD00_3507 [Blastocatellia bacterium]|nr:hypothetical protein [Blastocatellia bacterium]
MKNLTLRLSMVVFTILSLNAAGQAQSNAGMIRGTVTDQAGAVVSGARVRLSNPLNGYAQEATTNRDGVYQLIDVPLNNYTLAVEATGFERVVSEISIASNLLRQENIQLGVAPVKQSVNIESEARQLLDTDRTTPSVVIDRNRINTFPTAQPSRSTEQLITTAPGWTLDANGRMHARGIEYQVQYNIDGVPVTDTIASSFASSPDPRNFRSVEVTTANVPAEYGNKLAGIIAVNTRSGLEIPRSGSVTVSGGSFNTLEGSFDVGGHTEKFGYLLSAAATRTDRFLDPPALQNFHNRGTSGKGFFKLDYTPDQHNLLRFNLFLDGQKFDVPNLPDQQEAGQDQRRRTGDNMQSLSWQHTFNAKAVSYLALFQRYNSAKLRSNLEATPVFAEQSRHQSNYGAVGSLTYLAGRNTIKTGFEYFRFPVTESFTFAITDLDALLEKEPDLTEEAQAFTLAHPFFFRDHRTGSEGSLYIQDHLNATRYLTLDLGLRFDAYRFLVHKNFLSPRLGAAYYISRTGTVLRASYGRFMETPALENLLLSSSEEARLFSPGGEDEADGGSDADKGAPVQVSRESQVDVGFQQAFSHYLRLDADYFYRRLKSPPEITNFLETGIIFPANLSRSRSKGLETRLDLAPVHGFSGFLSYTNLHIYGFAPITGGLFLGEAVDLLSRAGQRIKIEEDQRNTAAFEMRYDHLPQHIFVALTGRHDSGFSVELDPDVTREEFANEFPDKILDQVNFERGFIKPHTVFNFSIGKETRLSEHVGLNAQFNIENLANKFYLITFESVFSGTTIGRPRTYSGRLTMNLK